MPRISLLNKFILFIVALLLFSVGPMMALSLRHSFLSLRESHSESVRDILTMAENSIASKFNDDLLLKSVIIDTEEENLKRDAFFAASLFRHLRSLGWEIPAVANMLEDPLSKSRLLLLDSHAVPLSGELHPVLKSGTALDTKNRSLAQALKDCLDNDSPEMFVFRQGNGKGASTFLAYLVPIAEANLVTAAVTSFDALEAVMLQNDNALFNNLKQSLYSLNTFEDGLVAVIRMDTLTALIPPQRPLGDTARFLIAGALEEKKDEVIIPTESGPVICYLREMPLHHTFIVFGTPLDEIYRPQRELLVRQGAVFLFMLLCGIALAVFLGRGLMKPLVRLSQEAVRLPRRDFTKSLDMASDLPVHRRDELGDLARSFAEMGALLHESVLRLVQTVAVKERLEGELGAAGKIQQGILPASLPRGPHHDLFSLQAVLLPAHETGGDLFDYFYVDKDTLCIAVGDVSGKGVPAALFMSMAVTLLRSAATAGSKPASAVRAINDALCRSNSEEMFLTLFVSYYQPKNGELRFACCGHPPPILDSVRGDAESLADRAGKGPAGLQPDLVLGLVPDLEFQEHKAFLEKGESLLFFTDGLSEAFNEKGEFYGQHRAKPFLRQSGSLGVAAAIDALLADIKGFVGGANQADDITVLMLRRNRDSGAGEMTSAKGGLA